MEREWEHAMRTMLQSEKEEKVGMVKSEEKLPKNMNWNGISSSISRKQVESLHYYFVASDPWWTRGRTRAPAHTQRCYMWVSQLQSSFPMARGTTATSWRCPCQRRIALLFNYTIKLLILFFSHTCSSRKMHQCSGQRAVFWNFILFIYFYYSSCKRLDGARKNHSTQN